MVTTFLNILTSFSKKGEKFHYIRETLVCVWGPTPAVLTRAKLATEATEMLWLRKIAEVIPVIINATLGRLTTLASL